jgi:DNA polymerase-3 subunit gamma/tau
VVWERILQEVGPMQRAHLQSAGRPAILGPNSLAIRFPAGYSSAYDSCASDSGVEVIRRALKRVTRRDWTVRVEQVAGSAAPDVGSSPPPRSGQRIKDLLELPLFKRAAEVLGAQIAPGWVDDGFDPQTGPAPDEV